MEFDKLSIEYLIFDPEVRYSQPIHERDMLKMHCFFSFDRSPYRFDGLEHFRAFDWS